MIAQPRIIYYLHWRTKSRQIYASSCRGWGIECLCDIDPTADLSSLRHLRQKRKREGGSSGTLGSNHLTHGANRKTAPEHIVQRFYTGRRNQGASSSELV